MWGGTDAGEGCGRSVRRSVHHRFVVFVDVLVTLGMTAEVPMPEASAGDRGARVSEARPEGREEVSRARGRHLILAAR
jgi:hypothetical protein